MKLFLVGRSSTGDHLSAVAMAREEALNKLCGSPNKPPSPKRQHHPPKAYCPPSPSSSSSSSSSSRARFPYEASHHPMYHQRPEPHMYSTRSYKPSSSHHHHHHHHYKQQHLRSSRHKALSSDDEDDDLPLIYTLSPPRSPLHPQSPSRHQFPQSVKKVSAYELNSSSQSDDEESDDDGIPLADEMRAMMRVAK